MIAILLKKRVAVQNLNSSLKEKLTKVNMAIQKSQALKEQLVPFEDLKSKVKELLKTKEDLKLEKGRVSITRAEQDTVDRHYRRSHLSTVLQFESTLGE